MESTARAEAGNTAELEENGNPPKKRKMDSLPLAVENRSLVKLRNLVNQGLHRKKTNNLSLSGNCTEVPIPFMDSISNHEDINFFVGIYPHFYVEKRMKKEDPDCLILPINTDLEQLIEVLELFGAICVLNVDPCSQKYGLASWDGAMKLRYEGHPIPKLTSPSHQPLLEKLSLRNHREVENPGELKELLEQGRDRWKIEAYLVCKRILKRHNFFPNKWVVCKLYRSTLVNWSLRRFAHFQAFVSSLYLIDLFGTSSFLEQLVNPTELCYDVVHFTLVILYEVLGNQNWIQKTLAKKETPITFEHLMFALNFVFAYQRKFFKHCTNDTMKKHRLAFLEDLTITILRAILSLYRHESQTTELIQLLTPHAHTNLEVNTLMAKACTSTGNYEEQNLLVIQLLLDSGFDLHQAELETTQGFKLTMLMLGLIGSTQLAEEMLDFPDHSWGSVKSILQYLNSIFEDTDWIAFAMIRRKPLVNLRNLKKILDFVCAYLVKAPAELVDSEENENCHIIVRIIGLMMFIHNSKRERKQVQDSIRRFKQSHGQKFNLLQNACSLQHPELDLELIQLLISSGYALQDCNLDGTAAFNLVIQLLGRFSATVPMREEKLEVPSDMWEAVMTVVEFFHTNIEDNSWATSSFENLFVLFKFSCEFLLKMHTGYYPVNFMEVFSPSYPLDELKRSHHMERLSNAILLLLKQMVQIEKTMAQSKKLKGSLSQFITIYELRRQEPKLNWLLKVCTISAIEIQTTDFKVIRLLLKAGADPNAVDSHNRSALQLLASKEFNLQHLWGMSNAYIDYPKRAQHFKKTVSTFLDKGFHFDQVDLRGETAFDCFKFCAREYPDQQLRQLLWDFFYNPRRLSCLAAEVVRNYILPCESLPGTLQSLVLQH